MGTSWSHEHVYPYTQLAHARAQHHDLKILKPEEMRLKFTEFVMMNQPLALDEAAASLLQSEKFNFSKLLIFDIKMLL
jgi:hypothetical protein